MPEDKTLQYRWYVLFLLAGVYTFAFLDKQLMVILQEPIKQELGLSDTQLGLITGLAFTLPYVLFSLPIAYLADRYNRKNIITIALIFWSAVTTLTGKATNFIQLVIARMLVGFGESGSSPAAYSIISDYFRPEERAKAFSIYHIGLYIGILISFAFGGYMAEHYGWRSTFSILGIPGVLFGILLFFTLKEPLRGRIDNLKNTPTKPPSFLTVFKTLRTKKAFWWLILGVGIHSLYGMAMTNWLPSFFIRVHGMSYTTVGIWLSLVIGICGSTSVYLGGYLGDKYGAKNKLWYIWIPAIGVIVGLPFTLIFLLSSSYEVMLLTNCLSTLTFSFYLGPSLKILQDFVPPNMRAMTGSIFIISIQFFGTGLGPL